MSGLVLLVEDNPDDEVLTLRALKKSHFVNRIEVARDGSEALDFLFGAGVHAGRDTRDQPQLILLDLKLPKISGLEVLRCIRENENTRRIPVVILTSSTEDEDKRDGYNYGVNSFVSKPVEFGEFAEAVQRLGFYWLLLNQPPPE